MSGSYHLVAQSIGESNPGFTGSGTIATLTFNVISAGPAGLSLQTDLADHPPVGQNANNIDHQDTADSVTAVVPRSSSTPGSPSSSPSQTPITPEFPSIAVIALFIALATAAIVLTAKQLNKNKIMSNAKELNN